MKKTLNFLWFYKDFVLFLIVIPFTLLFFTLHVTAKRKKEVMTAKETLLRVTQQRDSLQKLADSLRDESFVFSTQAGRLELCLDYLKEIDPKAWEKVDWFLSHETE